MSKWTIRLYALPATLSLGIVSNALYLAMALSKAGQWQRFLAGQSDIYLKILAGLLIVSIIGAGAYIWAVAAEYRRSGGQG